MSDYISRSKVITQLCNIYCACGPDECQFKIPHDGAECCMTVKAILDIPDADVRPVVRGEWYWDKDGMDWGIGAWRCSVCHCRPESWWNTDKSSPYIKNGSRYCSNCGADMREVPNEP